MAAGVTIIALTLLNPWTAKARPGHVDAGTRTVRVSRFTLRSNADVLAMYGHTVVWSSLSPNRKREYLDEADATSFHPRIVSSVSNPRLHGYQVLAISGQWIAWSEDPWAWRLWAMNRRTDKRQLVASSLAMTVEGLFVPVPSLYRSTVLWVPNIHCSLDCFGPRYSAEHWIARLRSEDLSVKAARTIVSAHSPCLLSAPSITANVLVWVQDCVRQPATRSRMPKQTITIFIRNRRTSSITKVTTDPLYDRPTTNGHFVAWVEASAPYGKMRTTAAGGTLKMLNLATGKVTLISNRTRPDPTKDCHAGPGAPWTKCDSRPLLLRDSLVWLANSGTAEKAMGLVSGKTYVLARGRALGAPVGSANSQYAAWTCDTDISSPPPGSDGVTNRLCAAKIPS
jgi:hypothetical protein